MIDSSRKPSLTPPSSFLSCNQSSICLCTGHILILYQPGLKSYKHVEDLHWHVVIGPVFRNTAEVETVLRECSNVTLYYNPDVKMLMDFCDISISAAGSTTYELVACGVPALLVVAADNQLRLAREAERQGMAFNLGWYHELDPDRLYFALDRLINNQILREKMAVRGQELIDGRGAQRVAGILLHLV